MSVSLNTHTLRIASALFLSLLHRSASRSHCQTEFSVMTKMFLICAVKWLLGTRNVASESEELKFKFYIILILSSRIGVAALFYRAFLDHVVCIRGLHFLSFLSYQISPPSYHKNVLTDRGHQGLPAAKSNRHCIALRLASIQCECSLSPS